MSFTCRTWNIWISDPDRNSSTELMLAKSISFSELHGNRQHIGNDGPLNPLSSTSSFACRRPQKGFPDPKHLAPTSYVYGSTVTLGLGCCLFFTYCFCMLNPQSVILREDNGHLSVFHRWCQEKCHVLLLSTEVLGGHVQLKCSIVPV